MTLMKVALLTLGDPGRMTGGYLFHRRIADRAHRHGAQLDFVSVPAAPLAWSIATGPAWLRDPVTRAADAVVLDSIAAAPAAPWLRGVKAPIIGMLHQPPGGIDGGQLRRGLHAPFDRWAYRSASPLMVASEWLADELATSGVPRQRLRVVPPGRDPGADAPVPGARDAGDQTRDGLRGGRRMAALSVANWLPRKGVMELLEAVAAMRPDLVTLHLVGDMNVDPPYARKLRTRLGEPDLAGRVVVHGVVPPAVVVAMYAAADVFVLPSFVEPYGTVWGEAMAAGLPVIGWRAGNLPYLADHEREALMAPIGDVSALAELLTRAAEDDDLRVRIGRAAAARAATRPTWDETAEIFFGVIADVLARRRRAGPATR